MFSEFFFSPYFTSFFFNTHIQKVKDDTNDSLLKTMGVRIQGGRIILFCFADDITMHAETQNAMQEELNIIQQRCISKFDTYNMRIKKPHSHIWKYSSSLKDTRQMCYLNYESDEITYLNSIHFITYWFSKRKIYKVYS